MYKYLRPAKIKRIEKSLLLLKIRRKEILAFAKNQADWEILAFAENQADDKILAPGEKPTFVEKLANWKSRRPAYCLGSAESPAADFSLVWLMSTFRSS
jgi:hypothetical protein